MTDIILHHYDLSPFAEKIRLALGYKQLDWYSVEIPPFPPRPDTMPLTAGYRRVPVMQIGADIYCDTACILAELERRCPTPSLYPDGQRAKIQALAAWADRSMFLCAAALTTSVIGDDVPEDFIEDRRQFMNHDFSKAASERMAPENRQRLASAMTMVADMLDAAGPYLFGDALSAADLSAYHPLWFVRAQGGEALASGLPYGPLEDWMQRIAAIGHATRADMTPDEALSIARQATPDPVEVTTVLGADVTAGQTVSIIADEPNDPIVGTLVGADQHTLVIAHESERGGRVHVHFPRHGYRMVPG